MASGSAEYTALLGLVGAALAGAGAVVGLETIGDAVASGVRTGICIVAGDVCRASDAEAAGLAPCTVAEQHARRGADLHGRLDPAAARTTRWTASRRSDGSVIVTHTDEAAAGRHGRASASRRARSGSTSGSSGKLDYALGFGRAWEFPDAASARRFLDAADREDRARRRGGSATPARCSAGEAVGRRSGR